MIIGANGTTGRIISEMLANSKKYQAIAMIRKVEQIEFFNKLGIETCIGDLEQDFSNCFTALTKSFLQQDREAKLAQKKQQALTMKELRER